jgi:hypothetical protein
MEEVKSRQQEVLHQVEDKEPQIIIAHYALFLGKIRISKSRYCTVISLTRSFGL